MLFRSDVQEERLMQSSNLLAETRDALCKLEELVDDAAKQENGRDKAYFFMQQIVPAMKALRRPVDKLEMIVDKNNWPMPSYGDLLFEV